MTSTLPAKITQASTFLSSLGWSLITMNKCRKSISTWWGSCWVMPAQSDRNAPRPSTTLDSRLSISSQEVSLTKINGTNIALDAYRLIVPKQQMDVWESRKIFTTTSCTPMQVCIISMEIARSMYYRREKCSLKDVRTLLVWLCCWIITI